jgi:methylmalonyl-CoA mutase cobalamin-binding domain/chain
MPDFARLQQDFVRLLLGEDSEGPASWTSEALQRTSALDIFNLVFTPAMKTVGDMFGRLEIFLPELIEAAERARSVSDGILKPLLSEGQEDAQTSRGRVLIGTVQGDLHDIGKNMVALMLQVNGFEVTDMGIDVQPRAVLAKAKEAGAEIVGLSSLMTTSMPYMREVVELRDGFGLRDSFSVIVGGAPITPEYSERIGADAFGRDAVDGVERCRALMERRNSE